MSVAKKGDKVKVHYTGTLQDGSVFDSSEGRTPLEFTIGGGQILPKFEEAVTGLKVGDETSVDIDAANAYGLVRDDLIIEVEKSKLPPDMECQIGQKLQMQQNNGQHIVVTVTQISDETVTLDANHELAGKDLNFKISLVEICD